MCSATSLGAQVLLDRHRVVAAALDGGVVGEDHALDSRHPADTGNQTRSGDVLFVYPMGRQRADFEEGRARIQQRIDPLPWQQFAPRQVACLSLLAAAPPDMLQQLAQLGGQLLHMAAVGSKLGGGRVDSGLPRRHQRASFVSLNSSRPISIRRISLVPAPIS